MAEKKRNRGFDLRQLECFCAVARAGNFTKAAEELGIAQPSLSEQIAKLEQGLGAPLFERLNRGVELTQLGEAILGKAQALLDDAAALPEHFERAREGVRGPLRVGAIPTILPYFLAPLLKGFTKRYRDVDLHLREGTTPELVEQVLLRIIGRVSEKKQLERNAISFLPDTCNRRPISFLHSSRFIPTLRRQALSIGRLITRPGGSA
jgi:DNA-binding transcriptional LysR family regulator